MSEIKQDLNKVQTSDYISKSSLIMSLRDYQFERLSTKGFAREYDLIDKIIEGVKNQPTVDEKEITRKTVERILEKIDDLETHFDNGDFATCGDLLVVLKDVLRIVKEEGGIE